MLSVRDASNMPPPDYSNTDNWLYLPENANKPFDVFYLYPTSWFSKNPKEPLCTIDNEKMRKAAQTVFAVQATAFVPVANVFSPYYRQFSAELLTSIEYNKLRGYTKTVPLTDCIAAFEHYIDTYNYGRPFVLAAHSQGSAVLKEFLIKYMQKNPVIFKRMIAAYLIGFGITSDEMEENPQLVFAKGADDTGVIISYNTEQPDCTDANLTAPKGSLVINPLNWRRDETYAPKSENLGSLITGGGKLEIRKQYADARIDQKRGTLISTVSTDECFTPLPLGTFHSYDFGFYYMNIRKNVKERADRYFALLL